MEIYTAYHSPIGILTLTSHQGKLTGIWYEGSKFMPKNLTQQDDPPVFNSVRTWLDDYFAGKKPEAAGLPLSPSGTEFQKLVWSMLLQIPYGKFTTYGALAKEAVKKHLGEEALCVAEPWMACESYQAFLKWWPGVITFTGICSEESGAGANHHTPEFDVDEKGMIYGVAAAVAYAVEFLNNEKEIPFKRFDGTLKSLVSRNLN